MFTRNRILSITSSVCVVLTLTACGGGGDDGGGNTQADIVIPTTPGTINEQNAQAVAKEIVGRYEDGFAAFLFFDPVSIALYGMSGISFSSSETSVDNPPSPAPIVQNNIGPAAVVNCPDGGSIEDSRSGNTYVIEANNCTMTDPDETVKMNGRLVSNITVDTIAQCPGSYVAHAELERLSFSVSSSMGTETNTTSGSYDIDIASSDTGGDGNCETLDVALNSDGFSLSGTLVQASMRNLSTEGTLNKDTGDFVYMEQASLPSVEANGMLWVETTQPIIGNDNNYIGPMSGTIEVSSNGEVITIIINSSDEFDANAINVIYNGVTTNYSWFDIRWGDIVSDTPPPSSTN